MLTRSKSTVGKCVKVNKGGRQKRETLELVLQNTPRYPQVRSDFSYS